MPCRPPLGALVLLEGADAAAGGLSGHIPRRRRRQPAFRSTQCWHANLATWVLVQPAERIRDRSFLSFVTDASFPRACDDHAQVVQALGEQCHRGTSAGRIGTHGLLLLHRWRRRRVRAEPVQQTQPRARAAGGADAIRPGLRRLWTGDSEARKVARTRSRSSAASASQASVSSLLRRAHAATAGVAGRAPSRQRRHGLGLKRTTGIFLTAVEVGIAAEMRVLEKQDLCRPIGVDERTRPAAVVARHLHAAGGHHEQHQTLPTIGSTTAVGARSRGRSN